MASRSYRRVRRVKKLPLAPPSPPASPPSEKPARSRSPSLPVSPSEQEATVQVQWKPTHLEITALKEKLFSPSEDEPKSLDIGEILDKSLSERHPYRKLLTIGDQTFTSGLSDVLLSASFLGCLKVVRYFLDHHRQHFDVDARVRYLRETPTELSDRLSKLSIISRVYCPDAFSARQSRQWYATTLLHAAVMKKHTHVADALLSAGASVDSTDCCSNTPLLQIVEMQPGEVPLIKDLIKHGADLNYQGGTSLTALMLVAKNKSHNSLPLVPLLLDAGADPSITDSRGYTALHIAASEGNVEVVKLLLHHGVDPQFGERGAGSPVPSPFHLANQAAVFITMFTPLQQILDKTNNTMEYHNLLHAVFELDSNAVSEDAASVTKLFSSHPECPSSCKSIASLVVTTSQAITHSMEDLLSNPQNIHLRDAGKIDNFTFPRPLLEAYTRKGSSSRIQTPADLVNVLTSTEQTSIDFALCQLLLAEHLLGYGQEGVIHLTLKVGKRMLFNQSFSSSGTSDNFQFGVLLLHRASEMLLFLVGQSEENMVGRGTLVPLFLFHLVAVIVHLVDNSLRQVLQVWSEPFGLTIGNVSECLGLYSRFLSSTHSHLVPDWDFQAIAHGILHSLCRWLAVHRDQHVLDATSRLVDECLVISDSEGKLTTLLHLAIGMWREGKKRGELIEVMLNAGANERVNFLDYNGYRPIHSAALSSTKGLLDFLLDYGAHIDACDVSGKNITEYCTASAHPKLASFFDSPRPLICLTSQAVIHCGIDYMRMDLPAHLKTMIAYHDRPACSFAH